MHTKRSWDEELSSDIEKGGNTALFSKQAPSLTPKNEETHLFFVLCQMLGSPSVPLIMAVIFEAGAHISNTIAAQLQLQGKLPEADSFQIGQQYGQDLNISLEREARVCHCICPGNSIPTS